MTDWLESSYQLTILRGVHDAAREHDARVTCFVSSVPAAPSGEIPPVHGLLRPESVDGLIVIGSGIVSQTEDARARFLRQLGAMPLCSIAIELPGASSVLVDNDSGLADAVNHLVKAHGYRRIGFICGPPHNNEAQQRLAVYRAALEAYAVQVDERLILPGDFTLHSGERAAQILLDERRVSVQDLDAVVAANDGMAAGFLDQLVLRGIRVPNQLAVVGFDDSVAAQQAQVPLSTVRQPLYEQGREAVRLLMERMAGHAADRSVLRTQLVTRRSCGCLEGIGRLTLTREELMRRGGRSFEVALLERRPSMLSEMQRAARGYFGMLGPGWEMRLVSALLDELKGVSPDAFRLALDDALSRVTTAQGDPAVFHEVVSALWRNLIPCVMGEQALRTTVEGMLDGARLAISAAENRVRSVEHHTTEVLTSTLIEACVSLCTSTCLEDVAAAVQSTFPRLGVSRLAIMLSEEEALGENLVRVLSYHDGRARVERTRLAASELADRALGGEGRSSQLISALHFRGQVFGIVCMELVPPLGLIHEAIRDSLGAALHAVRPRHELPTQQ